MKNIMAVAYKQAKINALRRKFLVDKMLELEFLLLDSLNRKSDFYQFVRELSFNDNAFKFIQLFSSELAEFINRPDLQSPMATVKPLFITALTHMKETKGFSMISFFKEFYRIERIFHQGIHALMAVDAQYKKWKKSNTGMRCH